MCDVCTLLAACLSHATFPPSPPPSSHPYPQSTARAVWESKLQLHVDLKVEKLRGQAKDEQIAALTAQVAATAGGGSGEAGAPVGGRGGEQVTPQLSRREAGLALSPVLDRVLARERTGVIRDALNASIRGGGDEVDELTQLLSEQSVQVLRDLLPHMAVLARVKTRLPQTDDAGDEGDDDAKERARLARLVHAKLVMEVLRSFATGSTACGRGDLRLEFEAAAVPAQPRAGAAAAGGGEPQEPTYYMDLAQSSTNVEDDAVLALISTVLFKTGEETAVREVIATNPKFLGSIVGSQLSKVQEGFDRLCVALRYCAGISYSRWDGVIAPAFRAWFDAMGVDAHSIRVARAVALSAIFHAHPAVAAVRSGQSIRVVYSDPLRRLNPRVGVTFDIEKQIHFWLEHDTYWDALVASGAIYFDEETDELVCDWLAAWDQAMFRTHRQTSLSTGQTEYIVRPIGDLHFSMVNVITLAVTEGDDNAKDTLAFGDCDCTSLCKCMLAQIDAFFERGYRYESEDQARGCLNKMTLAVADGKTMRDCKGRNAGWDQSYMDCTWLSQAQVLKMLERVFRTLHNDNARKKEAFEKKETEESALDEEREMEMEELLPSDEDAATTSASSASGSSSSAAAATSSYGSVSSAERKRHSSQVHPSTERDTSGVHVFASTPAGTFDVREKQRRMGASLDRFANGIKSQPLRKWLCDDFGGQGAPCLST